MSERSPTTSPAEDLETRLSRLSAENAGLRAQIEHRLERVSGVGGAYGEV